jgi:hypothetical protein
VRGSLSAGIWIFRWECRHPSGSLWVESRDMWMLPATPRRMAAPKESWEAGLDPGQKASRPWDPTDGCHRPALEGAIWRFRMILGSRSSLATKSAHDLGTSSGAWSPSSPRLDELRGAALCPSRRASQISDPGRRTRNRAGSLHAHRGSGTVKALRPAPSPVSRPSTLLDNPSAVSKAR